MSCTMAWNQKRAKRLDLLAPGLSTTYPFNPKESRFFVILLTK